MATTTSSTSTTSTSNIVSTLGAGSGIDVKALAQNLVDAEKVPKTKIIQDKITKSEARISAHGAMISALTQLKMAFEKINDASDFSAIKPSISQPSAFGVTASSSADAGNFSLNVKKIALEQRTASESFAAKDTPLNGNQPFSLNLTIGSLSKAPIAVTTPTPAGMVSAINGAKLGVTAQLINSGSGYNVVLTGATGATQTFSMSTTSTVATTSSVTTRAAESLVVTAGANASAVTVSYEDTANPPNTISLSLSKSDDGLWRPAAGATLPPATATLSTSAMKPAAVFNQPLQTARDAELEINGLPVKRSTNSINDLIDGVTIDLYSATTDAATLGLNRDTTSIKDNIKGLVTAYNDFDETMKILGDRASQVEVFGGALAGDSLLQNMRSQVRAMITETPKSNSTLTPPGTTIQAARDVGLSIDRYGKLTLNDTKLASALQKNFSEVSTMFSAGTDNNNTTFSAAPAGVAGSAVRRIDKMLLSTGDIAAQSKNSKDQIEQYKKDLADLETRMEKLLARYTSQFSIMDNMVGQSNSTRDGMKSSFDGMMASYTNK
jgi:flagellar hook-associated protein 2